MGLSVTKRRRELWNFTSANLKTWQKLMVEKEKEVDGTPISHFFHWVLESDNTYRLRWEVDRLAKLHAEQLVLSAIAAHPLGDPFVFIANFSQGETTPGQLQGLKTYFVYLGALRHGVSVWCYRGKIETVREEVTMTGTDERGGFLRSKHFQWKHVDSQSYRLSWDIPGLTEFNAKRFALRVMPIVASLPPIYMVGDFSTGSVDLSIPEHGAGYTLLFEGSNESSKVIFYVTTVNTLSIGECFYTEEKESSGGGESGPNGGGSVGGGSASTSSGSNSAFLHFEIIFVWCMAAALA